MINGHMTLKDLRDIHRACGYDKNERAELLMKSVSDDVGGAAFANVYHAKSFPDYCDAIETLDA